MEEYCKKRGLCPLCAKTRTRRRVFKVSKKNVWKPLTVQDLDGDFIVYKGYCVRPDCFSLEQAKRLAGHMKRSTSDASAKSMEGNGTTSRSGKFSDDSASTPTKKGQQRDYGQGTTPNLDGMKTTPTRGGDTRT